MSADAEQDAAVKLAQERAEIVAKYDRGRDGAQIEPWEDADYRLYKVTDRFGFLHPEGRTSTFPFMGPPGKAACSIHTGRNRAPGKHPKSTGEGPRGLRSSCRTSSGLQLSLLLSTGTWSEEVMHPVLPWSAQSGSS